jgi:hypothetical protein
MSDQPAEPEGLTDEQITGDEDIAAAEEGAIDPDIRNTAPDQEYDQDLEV